MSVNVSEGENLSLDNTKKEIQEELDKMGIPYKQSETKQQLLDKIGV
jgi:hypothetical protein